MAIPRSTIGPLIVDDTEYWIHQGSHQTTISNEAGVRLNSSDHNRSKARAVLRKAGEQGLLNAEQIDAIRHELTLD